MARLPQPGSDEGTWGQVLNDYLSQTHAGDGTLKPNVITNTQLAPDAVTVTEIQDGTISETKLSTAVQAKLNATTGGSGSTNLSTTTGPNSVVISSDTGTSATISGASSSVAGVITVTDKTKLDSIASGAQVNTVTSVASRTGAVTLSKSDVGLANVDNTSDAAKPVSSATQSALDTKLNSTDLDAQTATKISTNGTATKTAISALVASSTASVPSGGTTGQVLAKINGTDFNTQWTSLSGTGLVDGDKGDVTVSSTGSVWTIDAGAIATSKLADGAVTSAKLASAVTAATPIIVQYSGSTWPIYDTSSTRVRIFMSVNYPSAAAPVAYNANDIWYDGAGA